jgi:MFS family permease
LDPTEGFPYRSAQLLATVVAHTAPPDLRGTAFGFFDLVSGLSMLLSSALAGFLWETWGASWTFWAGAIFCLLALGGLTLGGSDPSDD